MNVLFKVLLGVGLLLVTPGCGGSQGIKVETVEVPVMVPVPCIDKKNIPQRPPLVGSTLTGDARKDLDIVSMSALSLRQTVNTLYALIEPCTIVKPK